MSKKAELVLASCSVCNETYWQKDLVPVKRRVSQIKDFIDTLICRECKDDLDNKGTDKWEGGPNI